jgi:NAD(P)-dependent dehydrogenase (short-subunit alcohol dehydrogenase family)
MAAKQTCNILITGASTGIGKGAALHWAKRGHNVFACVRRASDGAALSEEHPNIEYLIVDVTNSSHIKQAYKDLTKRTLRGHFHLVNNAGIAIAGPVEAVAMTGWRRQFDVNVFGALEMTQTFLPLIREHKGRIVNMSSVAGRIAQPFMGPYSASKFALEGATDALRRELTRFNIPVTLVEPGPIDTPIWDKGLKTADKLIASGELNSEVMPLYQAAFDRFTKVVEKLAQNADPVADVLEKLDLALFSPQPRPRYTVGRRAQIGTFLSKLPSHWADELVALQARMM